MAEKSKASKSLMELVGKDHCKLPGGKMRVFNVTYDLKKPGGDYKDILAAIRKCSGFCHAFESTWFVATDDPQNLRTVMSKYLHHVDRIEEVHRGNLVMIPALGIVCDCNKWLDTVLK